MVTPKTKATLVKMATGITDAMKGYVARTLAPLEKNVAGLIQRADRHGQQLESLERRASRHGDHLARLETRLKALEQDKK